MQLRNGLPGLRERSRSRGGYRAAVKGVTRGGPGDERSEVTAGPAVMLGGIAGAREVMLASYSGLTAQQNGKGYPKVAF